MVCTALQGQANCMFSHIMGRQHRQAFVDYYYGDDPRKMELQPQGLLREAMQLDENQQDGDAADRIKTIRSDEQYPWQQGKAPWSVEMGGNGVAPSNARENWGMKSEGATGFGVEGETVLLKTPGEIKESVRRLD